MFRKGLVLGVIVCLLIVTFITISFSSVAIFQRETSGNHLCEVPAYIQSGDILLMDCRDDSGIQQRWFIPGLHNDHAVMYIGNNSFVSASGKKGVHITNYTTLQSVYTNFAFANVTSANLSQKQRAVDFALNRLGAIYQNFFWPPWFGRKIANPYRIHPTANMWYCMELPWAAYYNQGIDIDRNGWFPWPRLAWVIGNDIIFDDDVQMCIIC